MSDVNLATEQLLELLLTLKKTTPAAARGILNDQPAIAYALITLMVSMNAIDIEVFQKTLAEFGAANASSTSLATSTPTPQTMSSVDSIMASTPLSAIPPHLQAQYRTTTPPSQTSPYYGSYSQANGQDSLHSYTSTPPNMNNEYGQQQSGYAGQYQQQQQQPSVYSGYPPTYSSQTASHQPPPTPTTPSSNLTDALASIPDDQKALILRVLSLTPEQINSLPPTERTTYIQIRATLGIPTG